MSDIEPAPVTVEPLTPEEQRQLLAAVAQLQQMVTLLRTRVTKCELTSDGVINLLANSQQAK